MPSCTGVITRQPDGFRPGELIQLKVDWLVDRNFSSVLEDDPIRLNMVMDDIIPKVVQALSTHGEWPDIAPLWSSVFVKPSDILMFLDYIEVQGVQSKEFQKENISAVYCFTKILHGERAMWIMRDEWETEGREHLDIFEFWKRPLP